MPLDFFAGRGATFGDVPYVVPVDAQFSSLGGMPYELVPVETLIGELREAKGLRIAILDACRDYPDGRAQHGRADIHHEEERDGQDQILRRLTRLNFEVPEEKLDLSATVSARALKVPATATTMEIAVLRRFAAY